MSFDEVKLSEAGIEIIDGDRGVHYPKQNEFYSIGYCLFLNAKNVTKDGFDFKEKSFITREKDTLLRKGKLVRNDIVLTTRGTVGNVAFYNNRVPFNNIRINSGMVILRAEQSEYLPEFVYWLFRSNYIQDQIDAIRTGSAQPQLPITIMRTMKVLKPKLNEQKAIAATLSALDDMIELNNQINKTLEEIAQAIFKSWFVDFEPFKDGEFEESELGLIPKGWRVGTLGEIAEITSGKRPVSKQEEETSDFNVPIVGASSIMGYVNEALYNEPILVIGRVGTHGVIQRFNTQCWPSDNTLVLKSSYYEFVYQILRRIDYKTLNRGSTQPLITQTDIKNYKIIIPDSIYLTQFEDTLKILFEQCAVNNSESKLLAKIRDTLLPKLMSGEIRVPVEEVV